MWRSPLTLLLIPAALAFVAANLVFFTVDETESAVVLQFGRPVRALTTPGLQWKWPEPVQSVQRFNKRIQVYSSEQAEYLTRDKKNVAAEYYVAWRIADPVAYLIGIGGQSAAETRLADLAGSALGIALGQLEPAGWRTLVDAATAALRAQAGTAAADIGAAFSHLTRLRHTGWLAAAVVVALYLLSGVFVVNPEEEAVVRRFGRIVRPRVGPGLQYRLPWPLERADKVNVAQMRREGIGVTVPGHSPVLHPPEDVQVLTGDENLIALKIVVQYRVKDPADYLTQVDYQDDPLVRAVMKATLTLLLGRLPVDDVLTSGKTELQQGIQAQAQRALGGYRSGLQVVNISLQEITPPKEVADAFRDVASAREDRERTINDAIGYRNSAVPQARGEAQRLLREAEGYRTDVINRAQGDARKFLDVLSEYRQAAAAGGPDVTRRRLYVETMERVLARAKKYVVEPGGPSGDRVNVRILEPTSR